MPGKAQYHKNKEKYKKQARDHKKCANDWVFIPKIDRRGGYRQGAGRRRKDKLIYNGKECKFSDLMKVSKVKSSVLTDRLYRQWPIEKAVGTPMRQIQRRVSYTDAIEIYHYMMRRFLTKKQRLESYKRVIAEMKQHRLMKVA